MMQKEVFLFERLDSGISRESIKFLKCIVFIRPTSENIKLLSNELKVPKYAQYYVCKLFIKILSSSFQKYF
jgi:vacuolar protein sorting-associated protein 45